MSNLQGVAVLVTRPPHQAAALSDEITAAGGHAMLFPMLAISKTTSIPSQPFDVTIFNSANGVICGIDEHTVISGTIIAMGPGTQEVLLEQGIESLIPDAPYNSECVLAMPALKNIVGKSVLLVTGEGGRQLLYPALQERGALVTKAEVYRRTKPQADTAVLEDFLRREKKIMTVTSIETLVNLTQDTPESYREQLYATPILVISERIARCDAIRSFQQVVVAPSASVAAIMEKLSSWAAR